LKNGTHVDDATGGAHRKKAILRIFIDIEDIMENAGFSFKETVITGDSLAKMGEHQKVLRLRWDIEKDKISVDVKINMVKTKRGPTQKTART
jgi:hypothetical protein